VRRLALVLVLVAAAVGSAGATGADENPSASASAWAIRITTGGGTATVTAPPTASPVSVGGFAYPADGSVISTGPASASASTTIGDTNAVAQASADVSSIRIFNGEITVDAVAARAQSGAQAGGAAGDFSGTGVSNLQALGQSASSGQVALADWGYVTVGGETVDTSAPEGGHAHRGQVTALIVHVNVDHGGLPAGSEIQIGHAETAAETPPPPPQPTTTATTTTTTTTTTTQAAPTTSTTETTPAVTEGNDEVPEAPSEPPSGDRPQTRADTKTKVKQSGPVFRVPPDVRPPLTAGHYVFPVYGPTSYGDTYGAPRADVSYHHGDDIFGQLGQPLLAVADGTVFSVGWNDIGGNRLWLRDGDGNEFYYAHLSAFSTLAVNGARVKAGQVVGFMGNTGDAETTPYHLHFEVHPVSLLYLGYDGAVNPTPYLDAWKRLEDLPFPVAASWAPSVAGSVRAPRAGAILLAMTDISSADGLDPASLRRVLAPPKTDVEGLPLSPVPTTVPPAGDLGRS
jgi:murein DD-endopeptidase MepM/ murein hydrolase activator NlpD